MIIIGNPNTKAGRVIGRLCTGAHMYRLPTGQYKFGGNKFVPERIAQSLPLKSIGLNNRGWDVLILDEDRHDH